MAKSYLHSGVGTRIAGICAIAVTLMLGFSVALTVDSAHAQKKSPEKKAAAPASAPQSSWVKLCDKGPITAQHKDGKKETKELNICMTKHESVDATSGRTIIAASLIQMKIDGEEKHGLRLLLPLGMVLPQGVAVTFFPKDLWTKVEKKEKLEKSDQAKLKALKFPYLFCALPGCTVEVEANAELVSTLKGSAGFIVEGVQMPGTGFGLGISLAGFNETLSSPPTDTKKYAEARNKMFKDIAAHREQLIAEMKKRQETLNKMQPNVAPGKAPVADPKAKK